MWRTLFPNLVTAARLLCMVLFTATAWQGKPSWALVFLVAAMGGDWLDGAAARWTGGASKFGNIFDRLTDRVMTVWAVLVLVGVRWVSPVALFILVRDVIILPALCVHLYRGYLPAPDYLWSTLTGLNIFAVAGLLLANAKPELGVGFATLSACLGVLGMFAGVRYVQRAFSQHSSG
jgi:phosphatidylglycerophosphate synthase